MKRLSIVGKEKEEKKMDVLKLFEEMSKVSGGVKSGNVEKCEKWMKEMLVGKGWVRVGLVRKVCEGMLREKKKEELIKEGILSEEEIKEVIGKINVEYSLIYYIVDRRQVS